MVSRTRERNADLDRAAAALGSRARRNQPLGRLTTYRVGGRAALFVDARSEEDLLAVRRALRASGGALPVLVLGKGSNLLVADAGFPGVVVQLGSDVAGLSLPRLSAGGEDKDRAGAARGGNTHPVVRAGGGLGLPVLARRTVDAGLVGLEWAVGVPGSVGGALRMNAGGHGSDVAASLVRYRWVDLCDERGGEDEASRLHLGYRRSSLRDSEVVVWAELAVRAGDPAVGRAALAEIVRWRREHQPGGSNAGSVFVNPPGDSAGRLVDAAGLKGLRIGSAHVSAKHANFIQCDDGGRADDVRRLIDRVRELVAERCDVELTPEVRLVGFSMADNGADHG